jgi:pilus assembly protein CpaC
VELGSGQSFMIAGLMSNSSQSTLKKMPGAGDLPILGSLFRSTHFQKGETELVIIVTPYLVNPVDANDIKLPTDGFKSPNVAQQVFGGMQSDGKSGGDRPKPTSAPQQNPNGPQVGDAYAPARAPAPQTASGGDKDNKKKKSKGDSDASPGFSLN